MAIGRPDGHEDCSEPAAPAQEDEERVEEAAGEAEGEYGGDGVEGESEVRAEDEGRQREGDGDEDDSDESHEAVSTVAMDGGSRAGGIGEGIGEGEKDVANKRGEGGKAATETGCEADVEGNGLFNGFVLLMAFVPFMLV